jgi:glutamine synthetase type III
METKEKKHKGRPSALEDEKLLDRNIRIWIDHFYGKLPYWELTEKYEISLGTIKKSIDMVQKDFIKIPVKSILQGAIFSIEERIKKLTVLLEKELKRKEPSIRNIKELNSELRADEIEANKLKNIYNEKYGVEIEGNSSMKDILKILANKK